MEVMVETNTDQRIAALTAELEQARRERDRFKQECDRYENEIAEVCGEDYSLKETFQAMSREIDRFIDVSERLAAERDQLRAALALVEWAATIDGWNEYCGSCAQHRSAGHAPDCPVGIALRAAEEERNG